MIVRGGSERADNARKANSPWRGNNRMLVQSPRTVFNNARTQQQALKAMSLIERETGHDLEWWEAFHAEQRARVFKRYGIA